MMNLQTFKSESDCLSADISSYIDGELTPDRELALEQHVAVCESCLDELNLQKKFLFALERALESEDEIDLPENFTKVVVTNAQSRVSGLRRPAERFNAVFICSALFLFILFSLGADSGRTFAGFMVVFEKVAAVGSFVAHIAYDVAIGAVIIIRSLSSHLIFGSAYSYALPGFLALYVYVISKLTALFNRG